MLGPEDRADNSPSVSSNPSSIVDIEDHSPLSPADYTIESQGITPAQASSHAADLRPEPAGIMDDIDTDFSADVPPQQVAIDAGQNSQAGPSGAEATTAGDDDKERRESGAAAGPSEGRSAVQVLSDSDEDNIPLGALMAGGGRESQEMVQRPNGLAPIRVNGSAKPAAAAATAAEKLRATLDESPTSGPPTPGAGRDAAADRAASAGNAAADRPAKPTAAAKKSPSASAAENSSSDEEDDSPPQSAGESRQPKGSGRKKRRNILPLKKACQTRRNEMMAELGEKGELPLVLLPQLKKQPSSGSLPATPQSRSAGPQDFSALDKEDEKKVVDPFASALDQIISRSGGVVQMKFLEKLLRLLDGANKASKRLVLLTVLEKSSGEVKGAFMHSRGFTRLLYWMEAADEGNSNSLMLGGKVLETLGKLPIDVKSLQDSDAGKRMRNMSKSGPESLRVAAKQLLETWKQKVAALPAAGNKRPSDGNAAAAKKLRAEPAAASSQATNGKPGTPKAGAKPAPGAAAQPKHADTGKPSAAKPVAPKAAPSAAAAKQELAPMAVLAAADLDEPAAAAAAPQPKPKPSVRDALYNPKKVHQLKVLDDDAAQKLAAERAEAAAAQKLPAPNAAAGPSVAAGANGAEASSSKTTAVGVRGGTQLNPLPLPASDKFGAITRITSFATTLGTLGAPTTGLGGPRPPPPLMSAATRAAQAAARVPSPERAPAKQKRKKVSWVPEQRLVSVRWFLKGDNPIDVRLETALQEEIVQPPSEVAEQSAQYPPGFLSAARAEHQSEAAAIRGMLAHPGMEDEEEADVPEMVPQLGWHMPPLLGAQYQPPSTWAAGEESQEKRDRLGASQQDHQRPGGGPVLDSPEEPPDELLANVQEKRVPLQIANAPPQQAQQPIAQASSPPMQHQQPLYHQPPPQQMMQQHVPQQMAPQQAAYQPAAAPQVLPAYTQLPPPPQHQPVPHQQVQQVPHQQMQNGQAPVDYVEQQLQQLRPQHSPVQAFPPQQERGDWGVPRGPPLLATAGGPAPIQLPAPVQLRTDKENVMEETRQPGQAGRGASGGWLDRRGGRAGGPAAGRGRSGEERKDNRPRQNLPCAFYNLELGCIRGDKCAFAHVASGESREEIQRRAERVSNQPIKEGLRRGPSIYHPNHPVDMSTRAPSRGTGSGAAEDGRKRGSERGAQWERNQKPRRERDREFDG